VDAEAEKKAAAEEAALLVEPGMRVGLGTGSTVAFLLPALAKRGLEGLRCVATSDQTAVRAAEAGLEVEPFDSLESLERLDIAIDGADQVAPDRWLVKGGGGAHTREKIVAAAAERFVVIVDPSKQVKRLVPPVPLELASFGIAATLARLSRLGEVSVREGAPPSPDGGVIADYRGGIGDPTAFAAWIAGEPGVVEHGLFPPRMVSDVIVGGA
jgi:ribose 5-phosphate isomerase A